LSYIRRKNGYEPGDTLALIAPFLIAYDLDDAFLVRVARDNSNFIKGSLEAIKVLDRLGHPLRIISTSYCQYVYYTTKLAGILARNTRCTYFPIDKFAKTVAVKDKEFVKGKVKEIVSLPKLGISACTAENAFSHQVLEAIRRLDNFFWKELPETSYRTVLEKVKPLGGNRKLGALKAMLEEEGSELSETETIGDSITDWVMLKETKDAGGLAISFNGNDYAVRNSSIAVISDNCMIIPIISSIFRKSGLEGIKEIATNWSSKTLAKIAQDEKSSPSLLRQSVDFICSTSSGFPEVIWIDQQNLEKAVEKSKKMRKEVRGVAIGSLG
jgi:energy-converting hydrogenase A subunit R